jgi:hypothetical protein
MDWGAIYRAIGLRYSLGPETISRMTLAQVCEYLQPEEEKKKYGYGSLEEAVTAMKAKKNEAS